jgi:hypothetical protein
MASQQLPQQNKANSTKVQSSPAASWCDAQHITLSTKHNSQYRTKTQWATQQQHSMYCWAEPPWQAACLTKPAWPAKNNLQASCLEPALGHLLGLMLTSACSSTGQKTEQQKGSVLLRQQLKPPWHGSLSCIYDTNPAVKAHDMLPCMLPALDVLVHACSSFNGKPNHNQI